MYPASSASSGSAPLFSSGGERVTPAPTSYASGPAPLFSPTAVDGTMSVSSGPTNAGGGANRNDIGQGISGAPASGSVFSGNMRGLNGSRVTSPFPNPVEGEMNGTTTGGAFASSRLDSSAPLFSHGGASVFNVLQEGAYASGSDGSSPTFSSGYYFNGPSPSSNAKGGSDVDGHLSSLQKVFTGDMSAEANAIYNRYANDANCPFSEAKYQSQLGTRMNNSNANTTTTTNNNNNSIMMPGNSHPLISESRHISSAIPSSSIFCDQSSNTTMSNVTNLSNNGSMLNNGLFSTNLASSSDNAYFLSGMYNGTGYASSSRGQTVPDLPLTNQTGNNNTSVFDRTHSNGQMRDGVAASKTQMVPCNPVMSSQNAIGSNSSMNFTNITSSANCYRDNNETIASSSSNIMADAICGSNHNANNNNYCNYDYDPCNDMQKQPCPVVADDDAHWVQLDWHHSPLRLVALAFDPFFDMLWTIDDDDRLAVHARLLEDQFPQDSDRPIIRMGTYARFPCGPRSRISIGFSGHSGAPLAVFTNTMGSVMATTPGGFPRHAFTCGPYPRITAALTEPQSILLGGINPGLMRVEWERSDIQEVTLLKDYEAATTISLPTRISDGAGSFPVGLSNNSVITVDSRSLQPTGIVTSTRGGRIILRVLDDLILVGNGTCLKVFDTRRLAEPLVSTTIPGNMISDADFYRNPYHELPEAFVLTQRQIHVLTISTAIPVDDPTKKFDEIQISSGLPQSIGLDCACVSRSGKLAMIGTKNFIIPLLRRPQRMEATVVPITDVAKTAAPSSHSTPSTFSASPCQVVAEYPSQPLTSTGSSPADKAIGLPMVTVQRPVGTLLFPDSVLDPPLRPSANVASPSGFSPSALPFVPGSNNRRLRHPPSPTKKQAAWEEASRENDTSRGFDSNYPAEKRFSAWPPENYMILSTEAKPWEMHQRVQYLKSKQPCQWLNVTGLDLTWTDLIRLDPRQRLNYDFPDPYPYNTMLGDDPSLIPEKLHAIHNKEKEQSMEAFKSPLPSSPGNLGAPARTDHRPSGDDGRVNRYISLKEARNVCYVYQRPCDWAKWNTLAQRGFIGIDNSLPESWIAPVLQCIFLSGAPRYPLRNIIMTHFCQRQSCVLCELNILFSNMQTARTAGCPPIVQLQSLLSVLKGRPEILQENIFKPAANRDEMVAKLHAFQRILIQCIKTDLKALEPTGRQRQDQPDLLPKLPLPVNSSPFVDRTFGGILEDKNHKPLTPNTVWTISPSANSCHEGIWHLLLSIEKRTNCKEAIVALPSVIVMLLNPEHGMIRPNISLRFKRDNENDIDYYLQSVVVHLSEGWGDPGHFVSLHRDDGWVLMNHYYAEKTKGNEMEDFLHCLPKNLTHSFAIAYYILNNYDGEVQLADCVKYDRAHKVLNAAPFATPLIFNDTLRKKVQQEQKLFPIEGPRVMSPEEIKPTDLVAIDAEYVFPEWGNSGTNVSDANAGKIYQLARVSCVLSSCPGDERILFDNWVATQEPIRDYLTQYSGVREGDLDPQQSKRPLTTMKAIYLKLRALVDMGLRFVGHGLEQDFRVCNIQVPPQQILDTRELYATPETGNRKSSVKKLAKLLLDVDVQSGEHDSIEDARTSLQLYYKYLDLVESNKLKAVMEEIANGAPPTPCTVSGVSPLVAKATGSVFPSAPINQE